MLALTLAHQQAKLRADHLPADAGVQALGQVHCVGHSNDGEAGALAARPLKQVVQHGLGGGQESRMCYCLTNRGNERQEPLRPGHSKRLCSSV